MNARRQGALLLLIDIVNRTCTDRQSASRLDCLTPRYVRPCSIRSPQILEPRVRPAEAGRKRALTNQDRIEAEIVSFNVKSRWRAANCKSAAQGRDLELRNRSDTGAFSCVRRFLSNKRLKGIRWMPWH
jgi:hypothetical protein